MTATAAPVINIEASRGWVSFRLGELWAYRELIYFLIWRDIKVRYKQTAIGAAWAVIQPLVTMIIFTIIFKKFANVPSDGLPYPIFIYTALLPWQLFAGAVSRSSTSLVGQANLIRKVYFPRLIVPISGTAIGFVDFAVAFLILLGMMIWYNIAPTWGILALPLFLVLALATALSVGLWLSALNVKYRDVGYTVPFLVQVWLFASPVAYPVSVVPEQWRLVYSLNPMVGVIEGFRWALLGSTVPDFTTTLVSSVAVTIFMVGGLIYFKRMERSFADIV